MPNDRVSERLLLTELEKGDDSHLKTFFSGQFEEKRLASVRLLQDMFIEDVKAGNAKENALSFRAPHWYTQGIEVNRGAAAIYRDAFITSRLAHSDSNDLVPGNRLPFSMDQVRRVTSDLEQGQSESLMKALVGTYIEEGVRYLQAVESINLEDLRDGLTKASLYVGYDGHKMFPMKVSVARSLPGFLNAFSNPRQLYEKGWDSQKAEQYVHSYLDLRQ